MQLSTRALQMAAWLIPALHLQILSSMKLLVLLLALAWVFSRQQRELLPPPPLQSRTILSMVVIPLALILFLTTQAPQCLRHPPSRILWPRASPLFKTLEKRQGTLMLLMQPHLLSRLERDTLAREETNLGRDPR